MEIQKSEIVDLIIVGAGPGGIAAAANAAAHGINHILFEKSELANTIHEYQAGKHVMSEPLNLPLRSQVGFKATSRENLLKLWSNYISENDINLIFAEVNKIKKQGTIFIVSTNRGEYKAKNVILGIGVQGSPRKLGVPGEDQEHVAYTLSDAKLFTNEKIVVVGAGDAAIENALALSENNEVVIINRSTEFPRAKLANSKAILDAIEIKQIGCYYNASILEIARESIIVRTPQETVVVPATKIIARLGAVPARHFLEDIGLDFSSSDPGSFPIVNERYETSMEGLYAVGALIGYPLIKQAMNQGFEVVEHILGNEVEPADQKLIIERLSALPGTLEEKLLRLKTTLKIFSEISNPQLRELILESKVKLFKPGEIIFNINDYTDTFFSIIEGSVSIEISPTKEAVIEQGNFFGEMSLLTGRRRSATVRAKTSCILLETQRRQILKLIRSSSYVNKEIDSLFVLRALETSIFPKASRQSLLALLTKLTFKNFQKGEILFKEGDIGDSLFILKKGSVQVSRKSARGVDVPQSYIPAGNYFGEMSLIGSSPEPRSATITAAVDCETLCLLREDLLEFLSDSPETLRDMEKLSAERKIDNVLNQKNNSEGALIGFMFNEGITDADNVLVIDSDLCVGCDNCEKACAATHDGTSRLDRKGGKSFASIQIPISCRHCENPLCMLDCPPDAIQRQSNGEVTINESCIGCENCKNNCPYDVIQMVYPKNSSPFSKLMSLLGLSNDQLTTGSNTAKATKCDMCNELKLGPACIRACPTGAAIRTNPATLIELIEKIQ